MPPSPLFELFKQTNCKRLTISTMLNIAPAAMKRIKTNVVSPNIWIAKVYPGEGKRKVILFGLLVSSEQVTAKKNQYGLNLFCMMSDQEPRVAAFVLFESPLREAFGEREVNVTAEFSFDRKQVVSLFSPIDVGNQSQILDEIVGFTGVKRDPEGKNLYTMEIGVTDASIETKLSFKQTVSLDENMPLALLETASKISALAVKAKEAT
jgi:hypothetical protein